MDCWVLTLVSKESRVGSFKSESVVGPLVVRHTRATSECTLMSGWLVVGLLTILTFYSTNSAGWGSYGVEQHQVDENEKWGEYERLSLVVSIMKQLLPLLVIALGTQLKAEGERELIYLMRWAEENNFLWHHLCHHHLVNQVWLHGEQRGNCGPADGGRPS